MPKRKRASRRNYSKRGSTPQIYTPHGVLASGTERNRSAYESYGLAYPVDASDEAAGWRLASRISKTQIWDNFIGNMGIHDKARKALIVEKGTRYFNRFALKLSIADELGSPETLATFTSILNDPAQKNTIDQMKGLIAQESDTWGVPYKAIADACMGFIKGVSPDMRLETLDYYCKKIGASPSRTLSVSPPTWNIYKKKRTRR